MGENIVTLISSLVEDGVFGEFKFVDLKLDNDTAIGAQFASSLAFHNLVLENSSGEKVIPLVVKIPTSDPEERELRSIDAMFYNEVTMYKEIIPALGYEGNQLPTMYYGIATLGLNPESDVVILENLKNKDFVPSKPKVFLDFDHISLAIKKIAEFHSLSYTLKNENRKKFDQLVNKLKEVKYSESMLQEFNILRSISLKRGFEAALKKKSSDHLKKCLPLFEHITKLIKLINEPEEPFAVICHGDFCNNNILFKYSETDEPVDCVIFDFQLSLYSSPAVDLMFFIYFNTTSDFREKYLAEILKLYWDTLRKNVPTSIPSFQEFLEHLEKRAIYGYLISAWFLPFLIDDTVAEERKEFKDLTMEEKMELFQNAGGEKVEKIICDMALELLKMNYVQKFLELCDEKKYNINS
ncbi:uncharacterized protein [Halyomorpha halys]|uniref:uncharacterized protein n=1 Tax=Halyomorpha halys TaxID=286706 RepID=UPI000D0C73E6|nr:uncharacterized protein LOC106690191 [Halyomorpha halys]KAE8573648.1 EcKinase 31 [Halyomorpha halys]